MQSRRSRGEREGSLLYQSSARVGVKPPSDRSSTSQMFDFAVSQVTSSTSLSLSPPTPCFIRSWDKNKQQEQISSRGRRTGPHLLAEQYVDEARWEGVGFAHRGVWVRWWQDGVWARWWQEGSGSFRLQNAASLISTHVRKSIRLFNFVSSIRAGFDEGACKRRRITRRNGRAASHALSASAKRQDRRQGRTMNDWVMTILKSSADIQPRRVLVISCPVLSCPVLSLTDSSTQSYNPELLHPRIFTSKATLLKAPVLYLNRQPSTLTLHLIIVFLQR
ncbi:uncharacterized protein MYCGRDRAFT_97714 [Zymoseptoria tritici IPO323]|uniref:Uncharacterized protein n=1 Tax=Zymoseptoria tritici (strain CBS 115943 / IPO323) TaxID=336722 RepID=F9XR53_ZYMTI|nr:uncharacterized protein MYCGRDRAFT_97714 [Zymoseptoria tritici IPO323]EGP82199.1 hypothetical protein MYCGRDRAFT_97714 [Zymoseptoria tritici IPO323]